MGTFCGIAQNQSRKSKLLDPKFCYSGVCPVGKQGTSDSLTVYFTLAALCWGGYVWLLWYVGY